jgi:hypothetical protein
MRCIMLCARQHPSLWMAHFHLAYHVESSTHLVAMRPLVLVLEFLQDVFLAEALSVLSRIGLFGICELRGHDVRG